MASQKPLKEVKAYRTTCYVNQDGITVIHCPQCGAVEKIDTNSKKYAFKNFRAKCRCGATIIGSNEYRRYCRKKVLLNGFYKNWETGSEEYIVVGNLSPMGVDFSCLRAHNLQKGDQLDITFTLDNRKKSRVTLLVEVLHINDRFIGVKMCAPLLTPPELGSYLM